MIEYAILAAGSNHEEMLLEIKVRDITDKELNLINLPRHDAEGKVIKYGLYWDTELLDWIIF